MAGKHYNEQNLTEADGLVPRGVIAVWSGAISEIPEGWALCDGQNGTPDLRDRFIVGAGGSYGVGATGGQAEHTHSHGYSFTTDVTDAGITYVLNNLDIDSFYPPHTHEASGTTDAATLDNRPPYYALAFIMKL